MRWLRPHDVGVADDHAVERVDLVDPVHLGLRGHRAHEDAADQLRPRPVAVQVEAVGVARVDEQLVGRQADQHVRVARVDADVALAGLLGAQRVDDAAQVGEGLAEDQPAPAEVEDDVGPHALELVLRGLLPGPAGDRRRRRHRPSGAGGRRPGVVRSRSDPVRLQPELEQAQLPELVALQRGELAVRVGEQLAHVLRAGTAPAPGPASLASASRTRSSTLPSRWVIAGTGK